MLGGSVVSARPLRGGMSSAVHLLRVRLRQGGTERVVLRREVRPEVVASEPDVIERERRALRLVESLEVPTPRLLGCDQSGAEAGAPALLMSALPGRVDWSPHDLGRWLDRLAELLPPIHALRVPAGRAGEPAVIPPYRPYGQSSYEPPPWARRPEVWRRAAEIFRGPAPDLPVTFVHRDFHPGNVLWSRGRVTGVVDWQAASVGPSCVDVGHCRANLLRYGLDVADEFTRLWERRTGQHYHPWADVVTIIGFLDGGLREHPGPDRWEMEDALTQAVGLYMP